MNQPSEDTRSPLVPLVEAYTGSEPFIFVSYAHDDGTVIFPEIKWLHQAGYRLWYDQGKAGQHVGRGGEHGSY